MRLPSKPRVPGLYGVSGTVSLLVDLTLPQGSSINATRSVVDDFENILKSDPDIDHWSFYIGSGAIRFYLPVDQQLANDFFAQAVVVTKGFKFRPAPCAAPSSSR